MKEKNRPLDDVATDAGGRLTARACSLVSNLGKCGLHLLPTKDFQQIQDPQEVSF